jgi:hypothetical protein
MGAGPSPDQPDDDSALGENELEQASGDAEQVPAPAETS